MDFIKAAEIAVQFEKDYERKYRLLEIKDNRPYGYNQNCFTCVYLNKISMRKTEVIFPQNAIKLCRMKDDEKNIINYAEITVDGCNVFWIADCKEADFVQGDFESFVKELADEVKRVSDEKFDLSTVYKDEILELRENVEELYKQVEAQANKKILI